MDRVQLTIPLEPKGKERPRWSPKTQRMYTPATTTSYEDFIKVVYRQNYGAEMAYYDDAQIVDSQTRKFYSDRPRVEILIQIAGGR